MELVVVNGASAISRGVLSKLAGKNYQKIRLLDFRPYRKSVYAFQRAVTAQGVTIEKQQVQTIANLEIGLEGASDVVYFTHDYFANTSDKNNYIQAASRLSKKHGAKKFVAVCPIEHELYWTEDKHTPLELRENAQMAALSQFGNATILNANLVFGRDSYVSHYITQCAAVGKIPKAIGGSKNFQYKPVASEDLATAVETALANTDKVKGKRFTVSGAQTATLNELLHLAEKQVGKEQGSTSLKSSFLGLGLSDYVEEFFTGITHDKNMARMTQYMEQHTPNFEAGAPDFFKELGIQQAVSLKDYFGGKKVKEEDLVFPIFTNYKMVSLD